MADLRGIGTAWRWGAAAVLVRRLCISAAARTRASRLGRSCSGRLGPLDASRAACRPPPRRSGRWVAALFEIQIVFSAGLVFALFVVRGVDTLPAD